MTIDINIDDLKAQLDKSMSNFELTGDLENLRDMIYFLTRACERAQKKHSQHQEVPQGKFSVPKIQKKSKG